MEFVHKPYQPGQTIAAIATPPGMGGVAIIRLSGSRALQIADNVFSGSVLSYQSHTVHYGHVISALGQKIDDALLIVMKAPRSFTGEDVVEIQCHGGSLIARRILDVVIASGAVAAGPGEFSLRAFVNGRLDLTQAEAIQELIAAKNEKALDAAEKQLEGSLSKKIQHFQSRMNQVAAVLEAWVDFPEEGLEFATIDELIIELEAIVHEMRILLKTFHHGKIIHEGITLCLIGSPNVGKSSLMNALLDADRAIVSPIAGTTRDLVEDHLRLNGLNFRLIDTAGIRHPSEAIEEEGIRRSFKAMQKADLILLVLDASREVTHEEKELMQQLPPDRTLAIWNKMDLLPSSIASIPFKHQVHVSAEKRWNLEALHQEIDSIIWNEGPPSQDEVIITNVRHQEALIQAITFCVQVIESLRQGVSPEFISFEMRQSLLSLASIIGTNITEDILNAIFSKFCIGK